MESKKKKVTKSGAVWRLVSSASGAIPAHWGGYIMSLDSSPPSTTAGAATAGAGAQKRKAKQAPETEDGRCSAALSTQGAAVESQSMS